MISKGFGKIKNDDKQLDTIENDLTLDNCI